LCLAELLRKASGDLKRFVLAQNVITRSRQFMRQGLGRHDGIPLTLLAIIKALRLRTVAQGEVCCFNESPGEEVIAILGIAIAFFLAIAEAHALHATAVGAEVTHLCKACQSKARMGSGFTDAAVLLRRRGPEEVLWQPGCYLEHLEYSVNEKRRVRRGAIANCRSSGHDGISRKRCWKSGYTPQKGETGAPHSEANIMGYLHISGTIPGLTLSEVRAVFGRETENLIDYGVTENGHFYTPTGKGSVVYWANDRPNPTGLALGITFGFESRQTPSGTPAAKEIVDDDVVQDIEIHEAQMRQLGR
jgi:hypothetical protein